MVIDSIQFSCFRPHRLRSTPVRVPSLVRGWTRSPVRNASPGSKDCRAFSFEQPKRKDCFTTNNGKRRVQMWQSIKAVTEILSCLPRGSGSQMEKDASFNWGSQKEDGGEGVCARLFQARETSSAALRGVRGTQGGAAPRRLRRSIDCVVALPLLPLVGARYEAAQGALRYCRNGCNTSLNFQLWQRPTPLLTIEGPSPTTCPRKGQRT